MGGSVASQRAHVRVFPHPKHLTLDQRVILDLASHPGEWPAWNEHALWPPCLGGES